MDPAPTQLPLELGQQQVAGLEAGGLDIVGDEEVGSGHDPAVDFPPIRIVRAAHVQMLARLQPLSRKDRMRRRGDGGQNLSAVDGLPEAAGGLNRDRARSTSLSSATSASRCAEVRLKTRTWRSGRTAATASTWASDWPPAPMMVKTDACAAARYFVARPDVAPVRIRPSQSASITARGRPSATSKRHTQKRAPDLPWV